MYLIDFLCPPEYQLHEREIFTEFRSHCVLSPRTVPGPLQVFMKNLLNG